MQTIVLFVILQEQIVLVLFLPVPVTPFFTYKQFQLKLAFLVIENAPAALMHQHVFPAYILQQGIFH
jgi:hypothetical protein